MASTRLRRTVTSALAVTLTAAAAVGGTTAATSTGGAEAAPTTDKAPSTLAFGGNGQGGRTDAERAYRDLLDHGKNAKILTAAHRGQWRVAPENSLPAIEAAFDDGAEIVELDVRLTADGVPVLMHDTTVDRTTDGTGEVSSFTLAEIKELRLKEHLGGAQTALTDERVPTLAEAMELVADRGLVNLDKGWPAREEIWDVLVDTGTVRNGLFKSDAPVDEVQAFRESHPDALYLHMISDDNLASFDEFGDDQPVGYEVVFGTEQDAVARAPFLERMAGEARVWANSMWDGLADHLTDEASLVDPSRGWERLVTTFRASMVQTDDVEAIERWLRTGEGDAVPRGSVRVQAEDFAPGGAGVAYHDVDAGNRGNLDMRPGEDVDISDADGNVRVSWLRGGEWLTYEVDVPRTGRYELSARVSSPYTPAGVYTVSFDGGPESERVDVLSTTSHDKQEVQASGVVQHLTQGRHTVRVSLPDDAFQNWNLDHLQLDRVR
ncbi:glycerophosphodiester phosphodiesterase family protein [Isoptericola cucumis]|uniref:Glycerophosphoryl diester phosphodiesterase n=1 Tax=Isoptericola cucumis TaxID=1776856 RepID=A0ABQ2B0V6_9MICO|nr:glycerophosphodiester phosphodiesterase family protein [Isoptericola cucumis]GGI05203.1 hypothetical protein GCM10007368_04980 [Isoptericola cucumis]